MTSSKIEMPGEVKTDPAALMASLHLLPSPTPNLEVKHTKVRGVTSLDVLCLHTAQGRSVLMEVIRLRWKSVI